MFFDNMIENKLEVWVCTSGGTKSNTLSKILNYARVKNFCKGYEERGCHYIKPLSNSSSPKFNGNNGIKCGIFIYTKNPEIAIESMKRRNLDRVNYFKCTSNPTIEYSIENVNTNYFTEDEWYKAILEQSKNWTFFNSVNKLDYPVIVINSDNFENNLPLLRDALMEILKRPLKPFPYKEEYRKSKIISIENSNLQKIKDYHETLPDFKVFYP